MVQEVEVLNSSKVPADELSEDEISGDDMSEDDVDQAPSQWMLVNSHYSSSNQAKSRFIACNECAGTAMYYCWKFVR